MMADAVGSSREVGQGVAELKAKIYERINKHFAEYAASFDIAGDVSQEIEALRQQMEAVKSAIEADDVEAVVQQSEEAARLRAQTQLTDATVDVMQLLADIDKELLRHDSELEAGNLAQAAAVLGQVHTKLSDERLMQKEYCDAKILRIVRRDYEEKRAHLRSRVEELWRRAVVWQHHDIGSQHVATLQVTANLEVSEAHADMDLTEVVAALDALHLLDAHLERLASQVMDAFLLPLCRNHALTPSVSSSGRVRSLTLDDRLPSARTRKLRSKLRAAQEALGVFSSLQTVIKFVIDNVFVEQAELSARLGKFLATPLIEAITSHLLAKAVPLHADNDDLHGKVHSSVTALQDFLRDACLLPEESTSRLTDYVESVAQHNQNRRRQEVLARARALMLADNFNTIQVEHATERGGLFPSSEQAFDGDSPELRESIYRLPTCHITETTKKVMDLVYLTLDEASKADGETRVHLFYAARDILDLFRTVVPTHHAQALDAAPQLAVTLYNDCMYIAHHLLSLGYTYRHVLPEEMQGLATFVDLVPTFRELGQQQLEKMMRKQLAALHAALDVCAGFADTSDPIRFDAAERGVKQTLHQLAVFAKTCKGVMPPGVFDTCMGALVSAVVDRVVRDVLALTDIAEEESKHLEHFVSLLIHQLRGQWDRDMSDQDVEQHVASWPRLLQLRELLAERLVVIQQRFEKDHWRFSPTELRAFIKAIFADSPKRQQALRAIH